MKYFKIMGERCSGTNFLQKTMETNFNLKYSKKYCHKHFFGHCYLGHNNDEDDTLFIAIIRNPIDWIDSFIQNPHYIPDINKMNINSFLFNPFYSIIDETKEINIDDLNIYTNELYKNIFEMRKVKNNFLIFDLPKLVKNYVIIKYEDLRDKNNDVLNYIKDKFDLEHNDDFIKVNTYKDTSEKYKKKDIKLDTVYISKIINNLDKEQEKLLGYDFS